MDHRSLSRPNLPGTTATPSSLRKTSVYATRAPPHFEDAPRSKTHSSENNPSPQYHMKIPKTPSVQKILQERGLAKIVDKLPYELRESVTSVLNLALSSSEHIQQDLEFSHHEIAVLRSDLSKKTHEMQTLQKTCEIYKSQLHGLEENIDSLKDNIDSRKRFTTRNRSAMSRLATTNRMLIDALDALQNPIAVNIGKALPNNTATGLEIPRTGQLSPLSLPRTPKGINHKEYEEKVQRLTMSQNDKLRESLLKIAREHYKSLKNAEHLETKVTELKAALKAQENLNRNLKSELDEIKAITQVESSLTTEDKHPTETLTNFKAKNLGQIDDRIQNLIDKNLFDPIDGIQQLRRILAHMASAPNSLSLHEMIVHVVSRDAVRIFGSDMICLFLVKPGSDNIIHKFSSRSNEPTTIEINTTKSIAVETIRSGKVQRVNSVAKNSNYNDEIDGCNGVVTRRVLSLPLFNTQHSLVIGSLHFLNKGKNFEVFTEADEVFGLIFAHQTSLLLTSCVMYDALFYHSQLLRGLLEASTDLYSILPDATSISAKVLTPAEVISAIERTARELFKCPGVKCFLLSDFLNLPNGQLLMLDTSTSSLGSSKHNPRNASITLTSATSGVAGLVVQTKKQYIIEPFKFDPYLNPSVDLDPLKYSMLTTPIIDLHGNVLGCLQLLVGTRSPRLKESDDPNDFRMLFPQAAEWFTHQIAPPLKYILRYLDRPAMRPVSTPSKISRSSMDVHHRASFFSNSEEVVTQMMSIVSQFQEDDSNKQLGEAPFVSLPFRRGGTTSKSFSINPTDESSIFLTSTSPTKLEAENRNCDMDNAVHEMLRNQLIEKQNEYEEVFERLQKLEKDFEEKETKLREKNRLLEEKSKNKIIELEEQYYAKQEIMRKEFENKISLLHDEIKSYKDEIAVLQENREGFETNLNYQLEIRLEYENKIADLQQQLKKDDDLKNLENEQVSSLKSELLQKNSEINELKSKNSSILDECHRLKRLSDQHFLELQQSRDDYSHNQQLILQLQRKLQEKDALQSILQDQIVRLAGQNIKDINTVMTEVNEKMSAAVSEQAEHMSTTAMHPSSEHSTNHNNPPFPNKPPKDDWIEQKDMLGRTYYYNEGTGESSWTDPRTPQPNPADKKAVIKGDWLQQFDESGNEYWINQITGQSEWVIPDEIQRVGSAGEHFDIDEDEPRTANNHGAPSIFDTVTSQYSATAGDYTIEL